METQSANGMARWTAPECPFSVDYSLRVVDDIRLAITDAFFSLPRGGAEIGGLLLGRQEKGWIAIVEAAPIECEHAFGPSFVLSPGDLSKLADQVAAAGRNAQNKVVGWYHSHTRSEIFLSDEDLGIHNRYFGEPWQVALVLKPHTFQPMRAGFFFRGTDGTIDAAAPHNEFLIEPLPMRPAPFNGAPPEPISLFTTSPREVEPEGKVISIARSVEPEIPVAEPQRPVAPAPTPPSFLAAEPPPPSRRWAVWLVAGLLGTALGAWGYHTRGEWLPGLLATSRASATEKLGLSSIDHDGQLQIQWNGNSKAALASTGGSLLIVDGKESHTVELGRPHVLTGSFTHARRTGHVDVTLALPQPGGGEVREATLFSGDPPHAQKPAAVTVPTGPAPEPQDAAQLKTLQAENARLRQENAAAIERGKRLEKAMEELRKVIQRDEQRRRLELQSPDTAK